MLITSPKKKQKRKPPESCKKDLNNFMFSNKGNLTKKTDTETSILL